MARLTHKHLRGEEKGEKLDAKYNNGLEVGANWIGISKYGKTPMYSGSFSGCLGVVMCGNGSWGAMAHLHQNIQGSNQRMDIALQLISDFICKKTDDVITNVLFYFGDYQRLPHGDRANLGQGGNIRNIDDIKRLMGPSVRYFIDLRRTKEDLDYGSEFVYVPGSQIVYTADSDLLRRTRFPDDEAWLDRDKIKEDFPYPKYIKEACNNSPQPGMHQNCIVRGLAGKGYCIWR